MKGRAGLTQRRIGRRRIGLEHNDGIAGLLILYADLESYARDSDIFILPLHTYMLLLH